jgi:hypothetical protein
MPVAAEQTTILLGLSLLIVVVAVLMYVYYQRLQGRECDLFNSVYGALSTQIVSISSDLPEFGYSFKDYYVKSAYNACSGGSYRNDYVSLCVLKNLLKQGVRGLDFEVFSIGDRPVVATSVTSDYHVKETFNDLDFASVMGMIADNAFASATAPNFLDPVVMHLRFKSTHQPMFKKMASILEGYPNVLLGKEYSYEYGGKNLGDVPLLNLAGKVVLVVDRSNPAFLDCAELYEYVNMTSSSAFMRALRYHDVKYAPDIVELIEFNKIGMTIAMPDNQSNPENPNPVVLRETGCQLLAMRYSLVDVNVDENDAFFSEAGTAFALKPEKLRYVPQTIPDPPAQNPEVSYATREVASDFYKFDI